jgi:hypothetical protein
MRDDIATEMATNPPTATPTTRSAAAERMRPHRKRRRLGLRCLMIQLRETEIGTLIHWGLLKPEMRNDLYEIREALYAHLDRTLGEMP